MSTLQPSPNPFPRFRFRIRPWGVASIGLMLVATIALVACMQTSDRRISTPEAQPGSAAAPDAVVVEALRAKRRDLLDMRDKPQDQPEEAHEFFLEQRLSEDVPEYPVDDILALHADLREQAARRGGGPGPGGILGWSGLGPGNIGGRTRALVIDPNDPDTLIAAGVTGGIWKSVDAGANWYAVDDAMASLAVCALVMDPNDSSIVYAGTGEGTFSSNSSWRGAGIFKSTDGGETWTQLPGTVSGVPTGAFNYVNRIRISPTDSSRLYAATRTGVWRSLDAGNTWSVVLRNPNYLTGTPATNGCIVGCNEIVIRPDSNPDILFASFGSFQADGLYRSTDGGDTWLQYGVPTNQGRCTLAFAPSNPNVLYLLMADNGLGGQLGRVVTLFRSVDGGSTFESRPDFNHKFSEWLLSYASIALGCIESPVIYSQGWHDNALAVDPTNANVVWVGGIDLYRSDNGGRTFGLSHYWMFGRTVPPPDNYMHVDQHLVVFHPDYDGASNQTMYVANDGGIWRTTNARAATSQEECPIEGRTAFDDPQTGPPMEVAWENLNNHYETTQFYHGDVGRDGSDVFSGGAQDNGTARADSTGTPNAWRDVFGGDGGYVAIDPTDSQTMYVETQFFPRIFKSTDGGVTFSDANNGITDTDGLFIVPFTMDPSNPDTLWTGGRRPWRTQDGAELWEVAGPNWDGPDAISAIAVSPSNPDVVYMGFNNGYVVRTTNGTAPSPTWEIFVNGLLPAYVSSVAVHPTNPNTAYITYSTFGVPHLLRTTNGGQSWVPVVGGDGGALPDLPAHWIAIRPCDPSQLYVATELGVFASDDGGQSFLPSNLGIPNTIVETLAFPDDDRLVAFTYGRGAHITELAPCAARTAPAGGPASVR